MENVTLKQLRYFEAVAHHLHFGRAAQDCAVSQPAVSVQIKELEEDLGQILFQRHARAIQLTAFGEEFAARVRPILRAMDDLGDLARAARSGLVGKLRLGVIPTIAPYLLPRVVSRLNAAFPNVDLRLRETQTDTILRELAEGRLDAALLALPTSAPELVEVPLFTERFVLVRGSDDAHKPVPNSETLARMRLLLLEEGHCFRDQALAFCAPAATAPRESMEGSSLSTLVQMVASGLGVTLIPEMAIPLETRSADVSVARFEAPQPARNVGMIWRRNTPLSEQLEKVAEIVRLAATDGNAVPEP